MCVLNSFILNMAGPVAKAESKIFCGRDGTDELCFDFKEFLIVNGTKWENIEKIKTILFILVFI